MPSFNKARPMRPWTVAAFSVFVCTGISPGAPPLAFPGAQGFGAVTPGGRGGKILRVTSLESTGKGTLREALWATGPRIIVFEVGGVIDLDGRSLSVKEPFVTIAGQTAPAPGITLIKGSLNIMGHDVVVQHLAVRPGEGGRPKKSGWELDGITTVGAHHVIIDHCSCTWATDECLSVSGDRFDGNSPAQWREGTSHDVTISNCIIAEALSHSTHSKGEHSKGTLLHDNTSNVTVMGNLYACNVERNPLAKGGVQAMIVNNWISNPGRWAMDSALVDSEWSGHAPQMSRLSVVGNILEYGPDTKSGIPLFQNRGHTPVELFIEGNLAFDRDGKMIEMIRGDSITSLSSRPVWSEIVTPIPAADVKMAIAQGVGARPWDRDPIDQRIVQAALDHQGKILDSEQQVGGYPKRPATKSRFESDDWDLETMERKRSR
jgi:pectate lyase